MITIPKKLRTEVTRNINFIIFVRKRAEWGGLVLLHPFKSTVCDYRFHLKFSISNLTIAIFLKFSIKIFRYPLKYASNEPKMCNQKKILIKFL